MKKQLAAHSGLVAGLVAGLAAGLMAASVSVSALTIGDIEIKSAYGERFSARIPFTLGAGEDVAANCVRLEKFSGKNAEIPMLLNYRLNLEPVKGGKGALLITTNEALTEPMVRIGLAVRCPKASLSREFIVNQKLEDTRKKK